MISQSRLDEARFTLDSIMQSLRGRRIVDVTLAERLIMQLHRLSSLLTPESDFAPGDWVVRKRDMGAMNPALVTHVEYDPLVEQFKVWFTAPEKGNTRYAYQYELEAVAAPERTPAKLNAQ